MEAINAFDVAVVTYSLGIKKGEWRSSENRIQNEEVMNNTPANGKYRTHLPAQERWRKKTDETTSYKNCYA